MTVDFSAIPAALAEALTISEFSAEIMISMFVILIFICVTAIFTRDTITLIIMILLSISLDIALGWLDPFFLVFSALLIALMYAAKIREVLGGG